MEVALPVAIAFAGLAIAIAIRGLRTELRHIGDALWELRKHVSQRPDHAKLDEAYKRATAANLMFDPIMQRLADIEGYVYPPRDAAKDGAKLPQTDKHPSE